MWTKFRPLSQLRALADRRRRRLANGSRVASRNRISLESLETRNLLSLGAHGSVHAVSVNHIVGARTASIEARQLAGHTLGAHPDKKVPKQANFTIAEEKKFLPGQWYVEYDDSSLFGPGAVGAQEITFNGPKASPTFISTTGVKVQGFFGPAYYQFSSWGSYQFLTKKLVRLTITGGSPTEYLNNGIIVMGGQFMPIQFLNKNQFVVQGQLYNRVPLQT